MKLKLFPEKSYSQILDEIGPYRYAIYDRGESVPGNVFSQSLDIEDYQCVLAGTGDMALPCVFTLPDSKKIAIPQNSPIIVVRLLREDLSHGEFHYNADDQIIFLTTKGDVFRLPRKDAPDHYLQIAGTANIQTVAEAYRLPSDKAGPIKQYSEKGAKLHIDLLPQTEDGSNIRLPNLTPPLP